MLSVMDQWVRNRALLEVIALHPADAEAAEAGGADRLVLVGSMRSGGLAPEPAVVSTVVCATSLPIRAMLRLSEGYGTTGGEVARLIGLASAYLSAGAEGLVLGFLNGDLEVDEGVCVAIIDSVTGTPWTFHRALDSALDTDRAWRQVRELPGVDAVLTAGSAIDVEHGIDGLTTRASADQGVARLAVVGGGLRPEHVPWLLRAGIGAIHVGSSVRPGASWDKAYVDAGYVRSWRLLLDDHVRRHATS